MEQHKLQVLAGQASPGHHGVTVPCAGVGGGAAEEGATVTPVGRWDRSYYSHHWLHANPCNRTYPIEYRYIR